MTFCLLKDGVWNFHFGAMGNAVSFIWLSTLPANLLEIHEIHNYSNPRDSPALISKTHRNMDSGLFLSPDYRILEHSSHSYFDLPAS